MRLLRVAVVLAVLTAAGCAAGSGNSSGSDNSLPVNRTFLSTGVTEHGADRQLVDGTRISLRFHSDGRLSADAGCNHMSGQPRLDGGKLILGDLAMTEMGCPGGRSEQDTWLAEVLSSSPRFELSGDRLTLTGEDVTIRLVDREVVDPDRELVGTTWTVDTIITGEAASSVPQGAEATLTIAATGTFEATTGCAGGRLTGTAAVGADRVTLAVTDATPCTGPTNELDRAVRATLTGELTYTIEARRLTLHASSNQALALTTQ